MIKRFKVQAAEVRTVNTVSIAGIFVFWQKLIPKIEEKNPLLTYTRWKREQYGNKYYTNSVITYWLVPHSEDFSLEL